PRPVALRTCATHDQRMSGRLKLMLRTHLAELCVDRWILELDDPPALLTDQMLVLRVAVIVLEEGPRAELQPPQHAGVHELVERPVDGRAADAQSRLLEVLDQDVRVEVVVLGEDVADEVALLARVPLR